MPLEVPGSLTSRNSQANVNRPHQLLLVGLIAFGLTAFNAPTAPKNICREPPTTLSPSSSTQLPSRPTVGPIWTSDFVGDSATVRINGREVGILWKPPYQADVTGFLKAGDNHLNSLPKLDI